MRARAYGESDKIVTFLTKDAGKLTGIAKGAKNSRRRFANCLDPFTRVRVHYRTRLGATLAFMESCDLLQPSTLTEPTKFAYGSYLLELVDLLTEEAHPIPEAFDLLGDGLTALASGPATAAFLRAFEIQLLCDAGYEPQLLACSRCQRPIDVDESARIDPTYHAVVCSNCLPAGSPSVPIRGHTLHCLEALKRGALAELRQNRFDSITAGEAAQLISLLLAPHLRRPLKSLKLIATLTA